LSSACHQPSGSVLDSLQATHKIVGDAVVPRVAGIQSTTCLNHRLRGILRRTTDDRSQMSQVEVSAPIDSSHVVAQRQTTVDDYAQVTFCVMDMDSGRRGSVVKMSVVGWRTSLIYA